MAGAAGLEPVTSAVTGQRSNQLSYAPAWGRRTYGNARCRSSGRGKNIRAADAKEVGVGNPAEETYCYPNKSILRTDAGFVNSLSTDARIAPLANRKKRRNTPHSKRFASKAPHGASGRAEKFVWFWRCQKTP